MAGPAPNACKYRESMGYTISELISVNNDVMPVSHIFLETLLLFNPIPLFDKKSSPNQL
jgi:hypothetical protein